MESSRPTALTDVFIRYIIICVLLLPASWAEDSQVSRAILILIPCFCWNNKGPKIIFWILSSISQKKGTPRFARKWGNYCTCFGCTPDHANILSWTNHETNMMAVDSCVDTMICFICVVIFMIFIKSVVTCLQRTKLSKQSNWEVLFKIKFSNKQPLNSAINQIVKQMDIFLNLKTIGVLSRRQQAAGQLWIPPSFITDYDECENKENCYN